MAIAKVQLEDGRIINLDVPEGTTEQDIFDFLSSQGLQSAQKQPMPPTQQEIEAGERTATFQRTGINPILQKHRPQKTLTQNLADVLGAGEVAATMATGAVAQPISGIVGGIQAINPFAKPDAGAEAVEATQEALTFQPRTESGRGQLRAIAKDIEPLGVAIQEFENFLGESTLNATGSPALATAAVIAPTALVEAIGGTIAFKQAAKTGARLRGNDDLIKISDKIVNNKLVEAAPDIDTLKETSRKIYREIDELESQVKPEAFNSLIKTTIRKAKSENVDEVLTPKSARVVSQLNNELTDSPKNISDLDQIRKKIQIAARSLDPSDARVGALMIDEIDSFMDKIPARAFTGDTPKIGERYKAARGLWGRARRAEIISDAMTKAQNQASGFENGIRVQLRAILNNKKRSRFFTTDEIQAMTDVVQGSGEQNILKLVGRLGFSEGQATNILGGLAGGVVGGPAVPVIGQISRNLAQRSTKKAAELSDAIVKAGPDGKKITEAYLRLTPKSKRSTADLSNLFLDSGVDLDSLLSSSNQRVREAAEIAKGRLAFGAGAATGAAAIQAPQQAIAQEQQ